MLNILDRVNMKISILFFVFASLVIFSCSSNVTKNNFGKGKNLKIPNIVEINRSTVSAMVKEIYTQTNSDFIIKANIIKVDSASGVTAIAGAAYLLVPKFNTDDQKNIIDSYENTKLLNLAKLKSGDTFKAVISFSNYNGWFIDSVLSMPEKDKF